MFLTRYRSANPTLAGNLLYLVTSYHTKNHFKLQVEFLKIFLAGLFLRVARAAVGDMEMKSDVATCCHIQIFFRNGKSQSLRKRRSVPKKISSGRTKPTPLERRRLMRSIVHAKSAAWKSLAYTGSDLRCRTHNARRLNESVSIFASCGWPLSYTTDTAPSPDNKWRGLPRRRVDLQRQPTGAVRPFPGNSLHYLILHINCQWGI